MYSAVIFDLDGTLLDTETIAVDAHLWAHDQLGFPADRAFIESLIGKDEVTCRTKLAAEFPELDTTELDQLFRRRMWEMEEDGIPLKPGVLDILDLLDTAGLPRAIATSSSFDRAEFKLMATGLRDRFQSVVTLDCVMAAKPAPDPYRIAAERLGHAPETCVAFEDSETGSEAAMRAGMTVVQVPDVLATDGKFAHHVAPTLMDGARMAGLIA